MAGIGRYRMSVMYLNHSQTDVETVCVSSRGCWSKKKTGNQMDGLNGITMCIGGVRVR